MTAWEKYQNDITRRARAFLATAARGGTLVALAEQVAEAEEIIKQLLKERNNENHRQ